jgi:hypothetical protein
MFAWFVPFTITAVRLMFVTLFWAISPVATAAPELAWLLVPPAPGLL